MTLIMSWCIWGKGHAAQIEVNVRMQIVVASCLTRVLTHKDLALKQALIVGGTSKAIDRMKLESESEVSWGNESQQGCNVF